MNERTDTDDDNGPYGRCGYCRVFTPWVDMKETHSGVRCITACPSCYRVLSSRVPVSERQTLGSVAEYIQERKAEYLDSLHSADPGDVLIFDESVGAGIGRTDLAVKLAMQFDGEIEP